MMNASGVSEMPRSLAGPLRSWRLASRSVISARSCWVTCGRLIQLACRRGPEIFWMRVSGWTSISPNLAKSTTGVFGSAGAAAGPAARPVRIALTNALTSSCRMRSLSPLPLTCARSTPSSRASLRTDGLACALEKPASSMDGSRAGTCAAGFAAGALAAAGAAGAACSGPCFCAAAGSSAWSAGTSESAGVITTVSLTSSVIWPMTSPLETLSPTPTVILSMTPFSGDGTSIDALSVSSVTSPSSRSTVSPLPTSTSITSTSAKSPRSGTVMSIVFVTIAPRVTAIPDPGDPDRHRISRWPS